MKILVTGATGYVGGRLVPRLLERGHAVRTTTSDPDREEPWWGDRVETVVMDVLDAEQVAAACEGVDAVYYLIHGMGGDNFAKTDKEAATNLASAVNSHGVDRVIYLSGIVPDAADEDLSEHIVSRREVERILSETSATVVGLRAAVLLGSGSTSFEIIRQVSERMPVHTIPTWMDSMVQPVAVVDALEALIGALDYAGPSRHFDVGGPDRLRYGALLDAYTNLRLRRGRPLLDARGLCHLAAQHPWLVRSRLGLAGARRLAPAVRGGGPLALSPLCVRDARRS